MDIDEKGKNEEISIRLNSSKNLKSTLNENYNSSGGNRFIQKQPNSTKNKDSFIFRQNDNSNLFSNFKIADNSNNLVNLYYKNNNISEKNFSENLSKNDDNQNENIFKETVRISFNTSEFNKIYDNDK